MIIYYRGIKSDIFSLGITLYYMISGFFLMDKFNEINKKNHINIYYKKTDF